jgi:hypothetical protein
MADKEALSRRLAQGPVPTEFTRVIRSFAAVHEDAEGKRRLHPDEFYIHALAPEVTLVLADPQRQQRGVYKKRADSQTLGLLAPASRQGCNHDPCEKREKYRAAPSSLYGPCHSCGLCVLLLAVTNLVGRGSDPAGAVKKPCRLAGQPRRGGAWCAAVDCQPRAGTPEHHPGK